MNLIEYRVFLYLNNMIDESLFPIRKKLFFLCTVPGIGPTYARYYDGHACHPTYYHYKRKRLHCQEFHLEIRAKTSWYDKRV